MKIAFTERTRDVYLWSPGQDRKLARPINDLIRDAARSPRDGIGKPEPLKGDLAGCWSRRIDEEHRSVYRWSQAELIFLACRFHYGT